MSREQDEQEEFDEEPADEEADGELGDDESDEDVEPAAGNQRQRTRSKGGTWLVLGVVAVVAACCIGGAVKGCGGGGDSAQDEKVSAISGCEELVKDRLKAPSNAEFSNESADGGDGGYVVDGDVDSENSFGAMLRSHFTCTVHSDGDQWKLDSMQIE